MWLLCVQLSCETRRVDEELRHRSFGFFFANSAYCLACDRDFLGLIWLYM